MSPIECIRATQILADRSASSSIMLIFFFQAEDGIRDLTVTGVQTCALPIYRQTNRHQAFQEVHDENRITVTLSENSRYIRRTDVATASMANVNPCDAASNIADRKSVV